MAVTAREKQVLSAALQLTRRQRARLAAELLASIEGKPDAGLEEAWALELERRARSARSGASAGTEWPVVRARLQRSPQR